jgi:hypothetical protein
VEDDEAHCGASGEKEGLGDGKIDEVVHIICEKSAQRHKENRKRATEGVNDTAAAKKAKISTLSTEQQSFVSMFNPAPAKIDKERLLCTQSILYTKHWRMESIVVDYWGNFEWFVTRIESII